VSQAGVQHYAALFPDFEAARGGEAPWLRRLRGGALEHLLARGFPTARDEEWRYTSVAAVAKGAFQLPGSGPLPARQAVEDLSFPVYACSLFVFVNGRFAEELSSPRALRGSIRVESLARLRAEAPERLESHLGQLADTKEHPFAALGTAFLDDGALVRVPAGERVHQPIHLVFVSVQDGAPAMTSPRVLVVAEPGSEAAVIQDHVSLGAEPRLTNAVTEVFAEENASVELLLLQRECDAASCFANLAVRQARDSRFTAHSVTLGGGLVRNDLSAQLADEGAECTLRGLFLGTGTRVVDNHTLVDHAMPRCRSRELYKGILGGSSRGVFRGRVIVRPGAQGTNAEQSNPNLILSEGAEVDTKPQLEIHADDVRCSHGSSIGQLDDTALFYLRARGIEEAAARDLLTQGFAAEITRALPSESLGERIQELLLEHLAGAGASP
jgi:Fe-S cluster assembly protein SufD